MVLHMMAHSEQQHDEQLLQFVHDIKQYLHVVGMGTEILKGVRENGVRFAEVCESMDQERRKALQLLDDFQQARANGTIDVSK